MIIDKILKNAIEDHDKSLQERVFSIVPYVGLFTLFVMVFIGIAVGDDIKNTIFLSACFLLFVIVVRVVIAFKKIQIGAMVIATVLVTVLIPISFIFGGGIYGGSPVWIVFTFAYIGMTVEGTRKYVLMVIGFITTGASYYIAYNYPEIVADHTDFAAHFDSFTSVIIASTLLVSMILLENRIYGSETRLIEKQKKEIEELSNARNIFFSSVSHEIRTPLDSIVGFNEVILRESDSEEIRESAENIKSASSILLSLINDVLDVSRLEAGKMEINPMEYDFIDMMSEVINMVWESAVEKGLTIYVDIDPEFPQRVIGDDLRIKQVLMNLISNSIKYTDEGSVTITVKASGRYNNHFDFVCSVEDTGIGIKKDELTLIFDEFARVNQKETKGINGTGLGLVIVKQLTEAMRGEIQVNSIYTKGSTFVVSIPQEIVKDAGVGEISIENLRKHREKQEYVTGFEAPGARVLIVDDDQMNRTVTARLLRDTKIKVDQAANGPECLEKCSEQKYDCIFMDQVMPEMDGMECLYRIRQQMGGLCRETPIVVITAFSSADDQAKFRMAGFDGYLLKPISGEMLENTLLRILPVELIHRLNKKDSAYDEKIAGMHKDKIPILISTESLCDLPKDMVEKMNVSIIPFSIRNKNGLFIDGVETETDGVLEYMNNGGWEDLKAECPSVQEYEDFFASSLSEADNVIHISMSSKIDEAYAHAMEAAASFDNVQVIDSGSLSCGIGILVIRAVEMIQSGMTAQECVDNINRIKKRLHTGFLINDVDAISRTENTNSRFNVISKIFLLKPAIVLNDGRGTLDRMYIGPLEKIRKHYIRTQLDVSKRIDKSRVFVTYAGLSQAEIDDLRRWVTDRMLFDEVIMQKESAPMAATHGAGTIGLFFMYLEE